MRSNRCDQRPSPRHAGMLICPASAASSASETAQRYRRYRAFKPRIQTPDSLKIGRGEPRMSRSPLQHRRESPGVTGTHRKPLPQRGESYRETYVISSRDTSTLAGKAPRSPARFGNRFGSSLNRGEWSGKRASIHGIERAGLRKDPDSVPIEPDIAPNSIGQRRKRPRPRPH